MPDRTSVGIEGLKELGIRMRGLADKVALKDANSVVAAGALIIKKLAIQNIKSSPSVDEGDLRDNVITKRLTAKDSRFTSEYIVTVRGKGQKATKKREAKRGAPHARFVEFGTVSMPAEPFLRPAFDQGKQRAVDAMVERLKQRLAKAGV